MHVHAPHHSRKLTKGPDHHALTTTCTLLAILIPSILACSTSSSPTGQNEFKLGFQDGQERAPEHARPEQEHVQQARAGATPSNADEAVKGSDGSTTTMASDTRTLDDHALGPIAAPSRAHLEYAQKQGMALPTPMQRTAGPFEGPERAITYIDHTGKVTVYIPTFHTVYFALVESGQFKWLYGASLQGYFMFDQSNDYVGLSEPPEKLVEWPMAVESAQQIANFAELYIEARAAQERGAGAPRDAKVAAHRDLDALSSTELASFWEKMGKMGEAFAALPGQRIASIGGKGCIAHYPYSYYIGCY